MSAVAVCDFDTEKRKDKDGVCELNLLNTL